jgi:cellobiose phosphorylase
MGSGDWNDGMNRVGVGGKGESVWLGWFLCTVIEGFLPLLDESAPGAISQPGAMGPPTGKAQDRLASYRAYLPKLKKALEQ